MFSNDYLNNDLSTTEEITDFDDSLLFLQTTPQPFDINLFQTTGPIIDEIYLYTTGSDYAETTEVPQFGAFTTEDILGFGFTTPSPGIDLSTIMTFPTDAPRIFTTGSILDFTTLPDLVTLGVTGVTENGLPPIPETTEFVPIETTPPPMIFDFTTPFQQTPTVPEWLFQTTADFGLPEITEDFTGLPFLTTPQPESNQVVEKPDQNPDGFDQDAFTNAIENAIKALENQSSNGKTDETDNNPTVIDENSVAVLIPVPNKSTTSSPLITSTSTTTFTTATSISSTTSTNSNDSTRMTLESTTTSSTAISSTIYSSTTDSSKAQMTTTTGTTTTSTTSMLNTTDSVSVPSSDTTVVVETIPYTTAGDESMLTNSPTTETATETDTTASGVVTIDVTTPVDLVVDLTTKNIDVTGNACFRFSTGYTTCICKTFEILYSNIWT